MSVSSSRTTLGSAMAASTRKGAANIRAPRRLVKCRRWPSRLALEAVLACAVDVALERALAVAVEAEAQVEAMGVLEARIGPQLEPRDRLRAAPFQHAGHQCLAEPPPPLPRLQI